MFLTLALDLHGIVFISTDIITMFIIMAGVTIIITITTITVIQIAIITIPEIILEITLMVQEVLV
jgi:hypothetical protein